MSEEGQVVGNITEENVESMEVESTLEAPDLPQTKPMDGEVTGRGWPSA